MTENRDTRTPNGLKQRRAGRIGSVLGCAAGLGIFKLIPFKSFLLELALVGGCIWVGGYLAQKIASK
jgi:hypothetical protein